MSAVHICLVQHKELPSKGTPASLTVGSADARCSPFMREDEEKMPNIALVANDLSGAGAQRVLIHLADSWSRRGHDVSIITTHKSSDALLPPPSVRRVYIDGWTEDTHRATYAIAKERYENTLDWSRIDDYLLENPQFRRCVASLRAELVKCSADLVISFAGSANMTAILACAPLQGVRVVVREGNDPRRFSTTHIYNALRRYVSERADCVVCNTKSACRFILSNVPTANVVYIPNPVATFDADALPWVHPTILTVGRLAAQKDHMSLLSAFAGASLGSWRLAIVGAGDLENQLRSAAHQLGISGSVDWYGFVRNPFPYYKSSQIFVLPSRFEGMPNALLEAMSFSLPCIVTDGSEGILEVVDDGETGLVVPAGNVAELTRALLLLAEDAGLRSRLGANARRSVGRYALENVVSIWDDALGLN